MDAQGPDAVERFAEPVSGAFPVVVDSANQLGRAFGFKAIPNGILVGPDGTIDAVRAGRFDIRRSEIRDLVESWLAGTEIPVLTPPADLEWSDEALRLFRQAVVAIEKGDREEAIRLLELAYPLEPDNMIIRKQLWAIEEPDRFYAGEIDNDWQRQRLDQGR